MILTQEHLDENPLLVELGYKVGAEIAKPDDDFKHPCPQGQSWSPSLNKCIDNVG